MPKPFSKPALTVAEQIAKLKERGLRIDNESDAALYLNHISYYRLGPYLRVLQIPERHPDHVYRPGARFEDGLKLYIFDRELRLVFLDAIERFEVSFRSSLSNEMCVSHGPHWFLDQNHFLPRFDHPKFLRQVEDATGLFDPTRRPAFAQHYFTNYTSPPLPPSWMITEVLPLGTWSRVFSMLRNPSEKKRISGRYGINYETLTSWVHSLTILRNVCAHHALLWNRRFTIVPKAVIVDGVTVANPTLFCQAAVVQKFIKIISPHSNWPIRLHELLARHPELPLVSMGFRSGWQRGQFWQ